MAAVIVLRPGYAETDSSGRTRAGGTITLITAEDTRILVDTGSPHERELILSLLAGHGLTPEQIDIVVCTHGHTDHVGNNNLFPSATFVMGADRSVGDQFGQLDFSTSPLRPLRPLEIARGARLTPTPGHTSEDISLLVDTSSGVVAVVGDLFEDVDDSDAWVQSSRDPEAQRRSREAILAVADFIVPGHGAVFSVRR